MISVIIPTYNRATLLPRAIESVLNQSYQDFELLVIDDGSTDNTKEIVASYTQKDTRVQYVKQEHSGGAARPKNAGIQKAKSEYIAVLDSDDEWLPKKLEVQLQWFTNSKNPNLRVVGCNMVVVETKTGEESKYHIPRYKNVFRQLLLRDYLGSGSCMLYDKRIFQEVGLFDEHLKSGQDREMRVRIAQKYDIELANDYLVRYYIGHDNISTALSSKDREQDEQYVFEKYKEYYLKDHKLWSEKIRYDGTRRVLLGETGKARQYFIASLRKNPLNFRSIISFILSLFGKRAYAAIAKYKMAVGTKIP